MKILDVCCRWPGSAHDATIFANSRLCENLDNGLYGRNSVLLADSAYGAEYYICKPLANPVSDAEKNYQKAQISSRNVAERTFGLLKRRFPCLAIGMHFELRKVQDIIVACCILHNFIRMETGANANDPVREDEIDFQREISEEVFELQQNRPRNQFIRIRDFLIRNYFNH